MFAGMERNGRLVALTERPNERFKPCFTSFLRQYERYDETFEKSVVEHWLSRESMLLLESVRRCDVQFMYENSLIDLVSPAAVGAPHVGTKRRRQSRRCEIIADNGFFTATDR